jgi:molecular chaperone DnaJ
MASKRDYYEVLDVPKDADDDAIKKSYRRLAMQYHPDRNVGDPQAEVRFKEAAEAFEVLRDPHKRQLYDRYGHAGLENGGGGTSPAGENPFRSFIESIFGFGEAQGNGSGAADLQCVVDLDLVEAARGTRKRIKVRRDDICRECSGSGCRRGTSPRYCSRCRGQGVVQGFILPQRCPSCGGQGRVIPDPCPACRGQGAIEGVYEREIDVPPGVDTGNYLPLQGEGNAGAPGRPRGDLFCVFRVQEHELFKREGPHLLCQVPITFSQAALGGEIEIPTINGPFTHAIPRGTQTGATLRFRGKGIFDRRSRQTGDLVVQFVVVTPRHLTRRQEELLRELDQLDRNHEPPERTSFLDKIRAFFTPEASKDQPRGKPAP